MKKYANTCFFSKASWTPPLNALKHQGFCMFLRAFGIGQEVEALVPSEFQELDPNHRIIIFLHGQLGEDLLRRHLFDGTPQRRPAASTIGTAINHPYDPYVTMVYNTHLYPFMLILGMVYDWIAWTTWSSAGKGEK